MPWYASLLCAHPEGDDFDRLLSEFDLSTEDEEARSLQWYESYELGVSLQVLRSKINVIQFFSPEHSDFKGFRDELPLGLNFQMKREDVHRRLGDPDHVTSRLDSGVIRHAGVDRYYSSQCKVIVTYSASSGLIEVLGFECPELH
jgi:hypothetical protein